MATLSDKFTCALCMETVDMDKPQEYSQLREKGCRTINESTKARNIHIPEIKYNPNERLYVHKECRRLHTHPTSIRASQQQGPSTGSRHLRSHATAFNFKQNCVLCGVRIDQEAAYKYRAKRALQFSRVMELEFEETLKAHCLQRNDEWATAVQSRILPIFDLPAAEAMYHVECDRHFRSGRNIPSIFDNKENVPKKKPKLGRPMCAPKMMAFNSALEYLQDFDDETITLDDLHHIMKQKTGLNDDEVYTKVQLTRGRGFQESTSLLWLLSMPACGEVHKALQEVTVLSRTDGDAVHKDLSQSRMNRDAKDLQTVLNYLQERKPFTQNSKELNSLSSGIVGEGSVNVDSAKTIGDAILTSMVGKSVSQHKFVKKDQVCTLASSVYVSSEGEKIEINPQQLYQRLIVAGIGNIQLTELFQYELCSYPSSLFDSKLLMRLPDKADLQNGLVKKIPACVVSDQPLDMLEVMYVVDGGAMLQRIPWPKSTSYFNLCKLYIQFIQRHYQRVLVVFDGYGSDPSTKDETHERRTGREMGVDVDFTDDMILKMKKIPFLANSKNKQKFINSLSSQMEKEGIRVKQSSGDADYDIAMSACAIARTKPVVVVGDDTDLLILLQHHFNPAEHRSIYLQTSSKLINIGSLHSLLDPGLSESLLFIHALSGCDTTSRPYGIGKVSAMGKYKDLQGPSSVFITPEKSQKAVEAAGNKALAVLYACKQGTDLNLERASKFSEKVASNSSYVPPERLPPTTDAAIFHSRRVYHQVQTWLGNNMEATEWGWVLRKTRLGTVLKPNRMEQVAAPASLLKMIRCKCTGNCGKNTCSCKKNGLQCTLACGQCKGITCTNGPIPDDSDSDSET